MWTLLTQAVVLHRQHWFLPQPCLRIRQKPNTAAFHTDTSTYHSAAKGIHTCTQCPRLCWSPPLPLTGALDFWYSHAMISAESHAAISQNCDFSNIGPLLRGAEALSLPGTHSSKAAAAAAAATKAASGSSGRGAASASSDVSSGLGHSGVSGWWSGFGSSSVTRFWEGLGLWSPSGFSHRDSKDMVCARW